MSIVAFKCMVKCFTKIQTPRRRGPPWGAAASGEKNYSYAQNMQGTVLDENSAGAAGRRGAPRRPECDFGCLFGLWGVLNYCEVWLSYMSSEDYFMILGMSLIEL